MIISTLVDAAYNLTDRVFVGRACGEEALAAVTVCFAPQMLFLAFGMTIGHGSSTLASIFLGKHNTERAEECLGQAIFLFFVFCAFLICFLLPFMEPFLRLFGATEKILPMASDYYSIIIGGLIFEKISYGVNNMIRAEGRPIFAMLVIMSGGVMNVFLDYIFLFEFGWGIKGAAWATIISEALGASLVFYYYVFSKKNFLKLKWRNLRIRRHLLWSMISAGSPSFVIQTLAALSTAVFVLQARRFGSESAIAVIGVSTAVMMFLFLPVVGLSMGVQPIIGYNWGSDNLSRVRETFVSALLIATAICFVGFLGAEIFAREIYILFLGADSALVPVGERALRMLVCMTPLIGVNIVASGYFQSTKRPKFSILITVLRQVIFLVPFLIFLPEKFGLDGVWASFPIADFAAFSLTLFFVFREIRKLNTHIRGRDI